MRHSWSYCRAPGLPYPRPKLANLRIAMNGEIDPPPDAIFFQTLFWHVHCFRCHFRAFSKTYKSEHGSTQWLPPKLNSFFLGLVLLLSRFPRLHINICFILFFYFFVYHLFFYSFSLLHTFFINALHIFLRRQPLMKKLVVSLVKDCWL